MYVVRCCNRVACVVVFQILYLVGFSVLEERDRVKKDRGSSFNFCEKAETGKIAYYVLQTLRRS